ncbi:MAG: hypothetical protein K2I78_05335 [Clostridia bacterium]|nr:hypothetical protein [Clostridia bacterium]MDE7336638.1 hypothetical protein [Clostridia bacterium]
MLRTLTGIFVLLLILVLAFISVCYWIFNCMTLEQLGYSDVEIGNAQMPNGEEIPITPRSLGIDSMTIKEMFEWFRSKLAD